MKLNLKKDIVFFDIESTGLSTSQDRIVQLAIIKYFADGRAPLERCRLVNPTIPISKEASEVHGITDEMVKDEPNFKQIAKGLSDLIGDADLCGFNSNRFDVPMLMEEFARAEVPFDMTDRKTVDVWKIYQKMEPRNLTAALKYYCNEEMEGAHDALNDVRATIKVFDGQLEMYEGKSYDEGKGVILEDAVKNDIDSLSEFTNFKGQVDFSGRIVLDDKGVYVFNFGSHQNKSVIEVINKNPSYYTWFMKSDFTTDSKKALEKIVNESKENVY